MNVHNDPSLALLSALSPSSSANRTAATARTAPVDPLEIKPNRTGLPPAATATAPEDLTVDGLLEAWGGKSERYDLNGDGGVNMRDLVELLKSMAAKHPPPAEIQPLDPRPETESPPTNLLPPVETVTPGADLASTVPVPEPTQLASPDDPSEDPGGSERITVKDLLAAWGTDNANFDLNTDGTVNMADLLSLLSDYRQTETQGGDLVSGDPPTVDGLLEHWGQTGSRYDLDGSGTVNMRDLVQMLGNLTGRSSERPGSNLAGETSPATFNDVGSIASSLVGRLRADGFESHPPSNIHKLVESLDLSDVQQKTLIKHLGEQYPAGLGVNLVG